VKFYSTGLSIQCLSMLINKSRDICLYKVQVILITYIFQELLDKFDAVLLCTGATWPRDLPIPGRQLSGIHFAMSFLESWQKAQLGAPKKVELLAKDKHVIVIGGGDTGCDCIATSLRQVRRYALFR